MKILSAQQVREADAFTIAQEPVASIDLMERAARGCTQRLLSHFGKEKRFRIFCGPGNNGGDGLAIARQLRDQGVAADVYTTPGGTPSPDHAENLRHLAETSTAAVPLDEAMIRALKFDPEKEILVDAIFGSGLNRPAEGATALLIDAMNKSHCPIVAIDIPSGLFADDNTGNEKQTIIRAAVTFSFQQPKLAFMFAENASYVGHFELIDIGLHPMFLAAVKTPHHYVDIALIKSIYRSRDKFSHKGDFGHALLFAGSKGKTGAAVLSARATLRAGAGLLTVRTPNCGLNILQTAVPEAMCIPDEEENFLSSSLPKINADAIGAGPGIGNEKETQQLIKLLIQHATGPIVFDADAINILAENKTWLGFLSPNIILTPHPGEFDRLAGRHSSGFSRFQTQRELSLKHGIYIVLKGAHTSISCPDGSVYFNSTGNPGMATAGSGDALTGIITGLLAQDYDPRDAAILGVYLHGLAGDLAAIKKSEESLIAGDLIEALGEAFRAIQS